jgi:2-polyprenyl-6-methoxyphenol hydroxylase-like FAD-dependent oxidoreductase
MTGRKHGIVLGGGWAGMLAAQALSPHLDTVVVLERDVLPEGPRQRRGQPQARHVHILMSGGARIVDLLVPGTIDRLLAAGARRVMLHRDLLTLTPHGWQHRFPSKQYCIMCSRPLMDWVVRDRVLAEGRAELRQRTEALDLIGDRDRITGVRVRDVATGAKSSLAADLVVDASGRGSRLRHWLAGLDLPTMEQDVVDAGMAYCSRIYQAPPGATTSFPPVNVGAKTNLGEPCRFGVVHPQEDGTWMVTLAGTRGAPMPTDDAEFLAYVQSLGDPIVADLIGPAEPLTPLFVSHFGANRRLFPERLPAWPDGLVVLGDALASFNPIYGHGMSAAARCAAALDERLRTAEFGSGAAAAAQRAISAAVDDPWIMATSKDIEFAGCRIRASDPRLIDGAGDRRRFADLIDARAARAPSVSAMMTDVVSLAVPPSVLGTNRFLALLSQDRLLPELTDPPLHPDELAAVSLRPRTRTFTAATNPR